MLRAGHKLSRAWGRGRIIVATVFGFTGFIVLLIILFFIFIVVEPYIAVILRIESRVHDEVLFVQKEQNVVGVAAFFELFDQSLGMFLTFFAAGLRDQREFGPAERPPARATLDTTQALDFDRLFCGGGRGMQIQLRKKYSWTWYVTKSFALPVLQILVVLVVPACHIRITTAMYFPETNQIWDYYAPRHKNRITIPYL